MRKASVIASAAKITFVLHVHMHVAELYWAFKRHQQRGHRKFVWAGRNLM